MARDVRTFTPKKAAEEIGCSSDTIRRYCALFKRHLSPGAAPDFGRPRVLTVDDVYLLQIAKRQTEAGLTVEEVDLLLDTVALPEAPEVGETAIEKPAPEVPEALALLRQIAQVLDRLEARDKRLDQLEASLTDLRKRSQAPAPAPVSPWATYLPFLIGVGMIALLILAVALVVAFFR